MGATGATGACFFIQGSRRTGLSDLVEVLMLWLVMIPAVGNVLA